MHSAECIPSLNCRPLDKYVGILGDRHVGRKVHFLILHHHSNRCSGSILYMEKNYKG